MRYAGPVVDLSAAGSGARENQRDRESLSSKTPDPFDLPRDWSWRSGEGGGEFRAEDSAGGGCEADCGGAGGGVRVCCKRLDSEGFICVPISSKIFQFCDPNNGQIFILLLAMIPRHQNGHLSHCQCQI